VQIPTEAWRAAAQPTSHVAAPGARDQQQGWDSWYTNGGTRGAIDEATHQLSDSGDYAVAFANVSGFMEDLGMFVKDRLSAMDSGHRETLLRLSASAISELVDGITAVVGREPKTTRPISTRLRMFYPISLSAFCPATSAFICRATGSALTTPSATRRLRL
jgi:hypothetical protein